MHKLMLVAAFLLLASSVFAQGQAAPPTVTLPVRPHVEQRAYTDSEAKFLATVPVAEGLREAVGQMLRANVIHVPVSGAYRKNDSERYWTAYQVLTANYQVELTPLTHAQWVAANTDLTVNAEAQFSADINVYVTTPPVPARLVETPRYVPEAAQQAAIDNGGVEFAGTERLDRVEVGAAWGIERERQRVYPPPQPPPPSSYCPPGDGGGNPGPNIPPDQPDPPGVNGQPWDPGPDAPTVADPVVEDP